MQQLETAQQDTRALSLVSWDGTAQVSVRLEGKEMKVARIY